MKEYLLFDLDGTLTDPKIGITTCVQYALKDFGIEEPDLDKLEPFIGPPLKDSFMKYYHFTEEEAERAIAKYRERFSEVGLFENEVYAGIPQMLRSLQSCGMFLAVASSKPTEYVERILEHFDLRKYFKVVVGSELDGTRVDKEEVMMEALRQLFSYKPIQFAKVYMIGDRCYDIEGAKKVGVESVGVTYGYGSMEELKEAHADYIVRSVQELQSLLMREGEALKEERLKKQQQQPQKQKGLFQVLKPFFYPFILYIITKSLVGSVLMMFLNPIASSMRNTLGKLLFIYDEAGAVVSLNANMSLVFDALGYIVAVIFIRKIAQNAIMKTKDEEKLKHLKADSTKSYVLFGLVTLFGAIGINVLFELVGLTRRAEGYQALMENGLNTNVIIGILCMGIIIPIADELVFRGMLFNLLKRFYSMKQAILLSSLIFGLYCVDSVQGMYNLAAGFVMAYAYEYYGNFLAPVLVHVVSATVMYVLGYTALAGTAVFSWPVCLVCLAVTAAAAKLLMKEKQIL